VTEEEGAGDSAQAGERPDVPAPVLEPETR
jgi:hypothetical protein